MVDLGGIESTWRSRDTYTHALVSGVSWDVGDAGVIGDTTYMTASEVGRTATGTCVGYGVNRGVLIRLCESFG